MALNGKTLGDNIANIIISSDAPDEQKAAVKKLWEDIGDAIVNHIKGATITVAAGIPVSTAGTAAAQTGSTTSTGTATIS
ncbi:MAG: hypothetical protein MJZ37_07570 [Bacilli bacterium]|nr:hypothetical protein [Bacilli bacterium]